MFYYKYRKKLAHKNTIECKNIYRKSICGYWPLKRAAWKFGNF